MALPNDQVEVFEYIVKILLDSQPDEQLYIALEAAGYKYKSPADIVTMSDHDIYNLTYNDTDGTEKRLSVPYQNRIKCFRDYVNFMNFSGNIISNTKEGWLSIDADNFNAYRRGPYYPFVASPQSAPSNIQFNDICSSNNTHLPLVPTPPAHYHAPPARPVADDVQPIIVTPNSQLDMLDGEEIPQVVQSHQNILIFDKISHNFADFYQSNPIDNVNQVHQDGECIKLTNLIVQNCLCKFNIKIKWKHGEENNSQAFISHHYTYIILKNKFNYFHNIGINNKSFVVLWYICDILFQLI